MKQAEGIYTLSRTWRHLTSYILLGLSMLSPRIYAHLAFTHLKIQCSLDDKRSERIASKLMQIWELFRAGSRVPSTRKPVINASPSRATPTSSERLGQRTKSDANPSLKLESRNL